MCDDWYSYSTHTSVVAKKVEASVASRVSLELERSSVLFLKQQ